MKNIMLKITSGALDPTVDDRMEFITEGKFYPEEDSFRLEYDETEVMGYEGCVTNLYFANNAFTMKRIDKKSGNIASELKFETGKRFQGAYNTPFGVIKMEVLTKNIKNNVSKDGKGKLTVDYFISMGDMNESSNELNIELS